MPRLLYPRVILEMLGVIPVPMINGVIIPISPFLACTLDLRTIITYDVINMLFVLDNLHSEAR